MPGVTHVAVIDSALRGQAVAVRAKTFGQCVDAIRALDVTWGPSTKGKSRLRADRSQGSLLPMTPAPPGAR